MVCIQTSATPPAGLVSKRTGCQMPAETKRGKSFPPSIWEGLRYLSPRGWSICFGHPASSDWRVASVARSSGGRWTSNSLEPSRRKAVTSTCGPPNIPRYVAMDRPFRKISHWGSTPSKISQMGYFCSGRLQSNVRCSHLCFPSQFIASTKFRSSEMFPSRPALIRAV